MASDPWGGWKGTSATARAPQLAAPVGPTEQKFSAQEQRIDRLESALQQLQDAQKQQSGAIGQLRADMQKKDEDIRKHMDERLSQVKQELGCSFTQALQTQSVNLDKSTQELKQLLLQKPKRTRAQRADDDEEMEGQQG